jgi:Zn-dependent peptidase ImmA (M78 family)
MTAADIFEREGIVSLPLDPAALARKNGVRLVTYTTFSAARKSNSPLPSGDGFLVRSGTSPVIVYNEKIASSGRQRWTLIHELCHLWLGHASSDARTEREVERLTASLISPLVVLHLCGVTNACQVARLCGISNEAARIRFDEMTRRRMAGTFLTSEEDRRIAAQFLPYISDIVSALTMQEMGRRRLRSADVIRQEEF